MYRACSAPPTGIQQGRQTPEGSTCVRETNQMCDSEINEMRAPEDSNATNQFYAREFFRTNAPLLAFIHVRATTTPSRGTP